MFRPREASCGTSRICSATASGWPRPGRSFGPSSPRPAGRCRFWSGTGRRVDRARLAVPARRAWSGRLAIGRHGELHRLAWPLPRPLLLAAYPDEPDLEMRVRADRRHLAALLGELPAKWTVIEPRDAPVGDFLAGLDVWVHIQPRPSSRSGSRSSKRWRAACRWSCWRRCARISRRPPPMSRPTACAPRSAASSGRRRAPCWPGAPAIWLPAGSARAPTSSGCAR